AGASPRAATPTPATGRGGTRGGPIARPFSSRIFEQPAPRLPVRGHRTPRLTAVIYLVINTFIASPYRVQQQSMEHTLEPDQYILVDKLSPRFDRYKTGDIVVFQPPQQYQQPEGVPYIKRVIEVGGDKVEIRDDGFVYVNNVKLNETSYVFKDSDGSP